MKPDFYIDKNPYYLKYSWVNYTSPKYANLGDCWRVYSPDEKDFELIKEDKLKICEINLHTHKVNMNLLHNILNSLRNKKCLNACLKNPCGEQCVHCKCLNCYVCDIRDYWEDKC